jgi:hypothetical protein
MKIKTTELQGPALDWAVANCEGELSQHGGQVHLVESKVRFYEDTLDIQYTPSTDWAQGGPIIERENINVFMDDEKWAAYASHSLPQNFYGTSKDPDWDDGDEGYPLVAAMRCYVASVLGDEVEVPDELLQS